VRHAILDQCPPLRCHTLSHISGPLLKYVTHLGTPNVFVVHTYIHIIFTGKFVLVRGGSCLGGFVRGFLFGRFFRGDFCLSPLLSAYIRYNRNLNITFNFRFRMYEKKLKSVTSHMLLDPSPCHKLSHLGTPPPRLPRA